MPSKYNDTNYMFSSARIRALETKMLGREGCERLISAAGPDEILSMLGDYGYTIIKKQDESGTVSKIDREATLMSALSGAFDEVAEMLPQPLTARFLQYKYDCNNIKAAIKGRARGIDPGEMMYPIGTVEPASVIEAAETGDYSILPSNMAEAAQIAADAYLKTKNPQQIDLILDRACFSDMLDAANETGVPYIIKYVKAVIDLTNILMCIRVLRMKAGTTGRGLLEEAMADGGVLSCEILLDYFDKGEIALIAMLSKSEYSAFAQVVGKEASLSHIEREADRFLMNIIREAKWVPFGAELSAAYLIALEYGLKNVRIIMAGKEAGLDDGVIRERIREMYV